jgi:hypothetical protein
MTTNDQEQSEYLEQIEDAHQQFLELIGSIPEEALLAPNTVGTWSGKDVIADVTGWEAEILRVIHELDAGREAQGRPAEADGTWDRFNQSNVDPTRDWTLAQVLVHFDQVHRELVETAAKSSNTPWRGVVRLTKTHYEEHHADLREIPVKVGLAPSL